MVTNAEAFRADTRTNQIVISDSASQVARIEEIIAKPRRRRRILHKDVPPPARAGLQVSDVIETFLSGQRAEQTASAGDRGYDGPGAETTAAIPAVPRFIAGRRDQSKGVSKPALRRDWPAIRSRTERKAAESAAPAASVSSPPADRRGFRLCAGHLSEPGHRRHGGRRTTAAIPSRSRKPWRS